MSSTKNHAYIRGASAKALDWSRVRFFKPQEFPLGELEFLNKYVIEELDKLRDVLGIPIKVSPAEGAVVRKDDADETGWPRSWHSTCEKRGLGQAIDVFLPQAESLSAVKILTLALSITRFRGLGFYFDAFLGGEPTLMLHLDLRHDPVVWLCPKQEKRNYIYSSSTNNFMALLESEWEKFYAQKSA